MSAEALHIGDEADRNLSSDSRDRDGRQNTRKGTIGMRMLRAILFAVLPAAIATGCLAQTKPPTPASDLCVKSGLCAAGGLASRAVGALEGAMSPTPTAPAAAGKLAPAPRSPPSASGGDLLYGAILERRERQEKAAREALEAEQANKSAANRRQDYDTCRATQSVGTECGVYLTHEENRRDFVSVARSANLDHARYELASIKDDDERLLRKLRDACGDGAQATRECRYAQDEIEKVQSSLSLFLSAPLTLDAQKMDPSLTYSLKSERFADDLKRSPPRDDLVVRRGGGAEIAGLQVAASRAEVFDADRRAKEQAETARLRVVWEQQARDEAARKAAEAAAARQRQVQAQADAIRGSQARTAATAAEAQAEAGLQRALTVCAMEIERARTSIDASGLNGLDEGRHRGYWFNSVYQKNDGYLRAERDHVYYTAKEYGPGGSSQGVKDAMLYFKRYSYLACMADERLRQLGMK